MSENSTREDLEKAKQAIIERINELDRKHETGMEGWRQQQSAEHGALFSVMRSILEGVNWLRAKWEKFTRS
jgi:hypothetical protein